MRGTSTMVKKLAMLSNRCVPKVALPCAMSGEVFVDPTTIQ